MRGETGRLRRELREGFDEAREALREKLEAGLSDEELERLARERLGLVKPGDKIFYFTTDREG